MVRIRAFGWPLILGALAMPSCKALKTGAREEFAKKFSCPEERVTVAERSDLSAYDVIFGDMMPQKPPEEVQDDPARLAKWKADHDDSKNRSSWDSSYSVFEASGCDHTVVMACHHPAGSRGGTRPGSVSCSFQKEAKTDSAKKKKKSKD